MKKNTDDVQTQINKMVIWDYILWFLSIFTGIMTLICYLQVYFSQLEIRFFQIYSYFYYLCLILYAIERKIKHKLYPRNTVKRFSEYIILAWLIFSAIIAALTLFHYKAKLELFTELIILDSILISIFGLGEFIKRQKLIFLGFSPLKQQDSDSAENNGE